MKIQHIYIYNIYTTKNRNSNNTSIPTKEYNRKTVEYHANQQDPYYKERNLTPRPSFRGLIQLQQMIVRNQDGGAKKPSPYEQRQI